MSRVLAPLVSLLVVSCVCGTEMPPDETTTTTTTTTTTVQANEDSSLVSLMLDTGSLTPSFDPLTLTYSSEAPNGTTSVTVTASTTSAGATFTVNGNPATSGMTMALPADFSPNFTVTVVVTAQDNVTRSTYTVTISQAAVEGWDLTARKATGIVSADGTISAGEWDDAYHGKLYVMGNPTAAGDVYVMHDGAFLMVALQVMDDSIDIGSGWWDTDRLAVYIDKDNDKSSAPNTDDDLFLVLRGNARSQDVGTGSAWANGTTLGSWTGATTSNAAGWTAEYLIPFPLLEITSGQPKTLGIDFAAVNQSASLYPRWTEDDNTNWQNPARWGTISSDTWQ